MEYKIIFSSDAKKDLKALQKKAPQALSKLAQLLDELREHPRTGTGQVVLSDSTNNPIYSIDASSRIIIFTKI